MDFQPQVYKGKDGKIYKKQDGKFVELTPQELENFEFVPLREESEVQVKSEYMSPEEQGELIDKALISAASTLGSIALGGGMVALMSNPVTAIPTAALGAGVLGSIAAYSPEKFKTGVIGMAKGAVEPYISPSESFKEDPFGTALALAPIATLSYGIGKPFTKQLFEGLSKKFVTRMGNPANKQLVFDPLKEEFKTMEEPLQYMRDKKVPLTVAQTTESPLAMSILSENPKVPEILVKQNRVISRDLQDILDTLDYRLKLKSELGDIAEIIADETRIRYVDLLEKLGKTKSTLFRAAEKSLPTIQFTNPETGKTIKIPGAIRLDNSTKVINKMGEADFQMVLNSMVASKSTKKMFKNVTEITDRLRMVLQSLKEVKVIPSENIRVLDYMRQNVDNTLQKLPADNPQRKLLAEFRDALDKDIEAGFRQAGLLDKYRKYKDYAHTSLSKFKKTETGELLIPGSVYDVEYSPTNAVRAAFEDSSKFEDLVNIVGSKTAVGGLLNYIFGKAADPQTGGFSADILIREIARHKDKLNFLEPGLKTRLFNLAYGIKAQNRLSVPNPAFELKGPDAVIKVGGATATGRKGIIVGQIASATRYLLSKTDVANIMLDPEMGWLAAKLANTQVGTPAYTSRMRRFLQGLNRLGIYARVGDTLFSFDVNGVPVPVGDVKKED